MISSWLQGTKKSLQHLKILMKRENTIQLEMDVEVNMKLNTVMRTMRMIQNCKHGYNVE